MRRCMTCRRTLRPRDHYSASTRFLQIVQNSAQELLRTRIRERTAAARESTRESIHLARLQANPMVRLESRHRRHRLDDIQPVHRLAFLIAAPLVKGRSHRKEAWKTNAAQEV